jgi:hypothetical protein
LPTFTELPTFTDYEEIDKEEQQASAITSEVAALTDPILLVDIQVVEIATQHTRANLPAKGVNRPVSLELFIQNVGLGEAFTIDFNEVEDFIFRRLTGHEPPESGGRAIIAFQHFNELAVIQNGIERLAPQQKKRLARIVLKDNGGILGRV